MRPIVQILKVYFVLFSRFHRQKQNHLNFGCKVGKERIDEIENPELGMERVKSLYEKKGYRERLD